MKVGSNENKVDNVWKQIWKSWHKKKIFLPLSLTNLVKNSEFI